MKVFPLRRIPYSITVFPGAVTCAGDLGTMWGTDSRINERFERSISLILFLDIIFYPYNKDN